MHRVNLSVIIPAYAREELLEACLKSLKKKIQGHLDYEVVVVDDGSGINEKQIRDRVRPDYPLVWGSFPSNKGRSAARNAAVALSKGSIVVFMDSDMITLPGFIKAHEKIHTDNPTIAAVGMINWAGKGSWVRYCGSRGVSKLKEGDEVPARYFVTGNASVEKKDLSDMPFNEALECWGGEDLELALRLQKNGVRFMKAADAVCLHNHAVGLKVHLERVRDYGAKTLPYIIGHNPQLRTELRLDLLSSPFWRFAASNLISMPLVLIAVLLDRVKLPDKLYDFLVWSSYSRGWMESMR